MGYRIDPAEPTDLELRRVLREQLAKAAEVLRVPGGPDAEAVHGARKRLKKARSLVRLARADLGPAVARHANAELRRVGADLATQRDADALVEAVDRLLAVAAGGPPVGAPRGATPSPAAGSSARAGAGSPAGAAPGDVHAPADAPGDADAPDTVAALAAVRDRLAVRAERVRAGGAIDRATLLGAARVLDQLVAWIDLVPPKAEGWAAIGPGLAHQHRRARTALAALPDEPSALELHEWRKRVKDLWYHQRLLRRLWPEAQRPLVEAADELAAALGDDHDLALLLELLATPDGADRPAPDAPAPDAPAPDGPASDGIDAPGGRVALVTEAAGGGPAETTETVELDEADRALVVAAAEAERARLQARARHLGARLLADRAGPWADRHGAWWAAAVGEARQARAADGAGGAPTPAEPGAGRGGPDPSGDGANA